MGQERAAILNLDEQGNVTLPLQFRMKLKFSKKVFVSLHIDGNGNRHKVTINRNENNEFNLRDTKTNKLKQYDFNEGIIPIESFIYDNNVDINQVVVWFDEDNKELVFQCLLSE